MKTVGKSTVAPQAWGGRRQAWPLVDDAALSVKEEAMPPGARETRHLHDRARQAFYVLSGAPTMDFGGETARIAPGEALEVAPGTPHMAVNEGSETAVFLVISAQSTAGDPREL